MIIFDYGSLFCSVPIPFEGDYLKISDSAAWAKQKTKLSNDLKVVFTDNILKTHRKNGKVGCFFQFLLTLLFNAA